MKHYSIALDEFVEELYREMVSQQDGGAAHYCRIDADSPEEAADILFSCRRGFFVAKFYESDDYGYDLSG